jgi:hypothetical protein
VSHDEFKVRPLHLWWTSTVGLVGYGYLLWQLGIAGETDVATWLVVALVGFLWAVFQLRSWWWGRDNALPVVDPPPGRLVDSPDGPRLPAGEAEVLADAAMLPLRAPPSLAIGATVLVSVGLAGTFLGLTLGLFDAVPLLADRKTEEAIEALLGGAKLAFVKSLAGIVLATLWTVRMVEVRVEEERRRRLILSSLEHRFPPISPEQLLADALASQAAHAESILHRLTLLSDQLGRAEQAEGTRHDATMAAAAKRKNALLLAMQAETAHHDAAMGASAKRQDALLLAMTSLRGSEYASLAALQAATEDLKATLQDLGEKVPERIGVQAGQSVGNLLQPRLEDLAKTLQVLGTTGRDAIGDAMRADMGAEVGELRGALVAVSNALVTLPELMAQGGRQAIAGLNTASQGGAAQIAKAAGDLAARTDETKESVQELRSALHAAGQLVAEIQGGGERLRDAFDDVARPLVSLPMTLDRAREGIDAAGKAASGAATELARAGETVAGHLTEGADSAALRLQTAASSMGEVLQGAAGAVGGALRTGGSDLGAQLEIAGRVLQEGVSTELVAIRDSLRVQADAQRALAATWQTEREAMLEGARQAHAQFTAIESNGRVLVDSVDALRAACATTVEALSRVSGNERQSADEAVKQMLSAVQAFSGALEASQEAVKSASFATVASTEQVTAKAAREVAEALSQGAEALTSAMHRAEEIGNRIDAQSEMLVRNMAAANAAASAMEAHGAALATSGATLKHELHGLGQPLNDARVSLQQVPISVVAATSALEEERKALSGLGLSLKEQAHLIREQERALGDRTAELRRLHEILGQQWAGHVGRMVEAHEQVRRAWQEAMRAAGEGIDKNAEQIGRYAERVDQALGLKAEVAGLQDGLQNLADSLGALSDIGKALGGLDTRLGALGDLPAVLGSLTHEVAKLQDAVDSMTSLDPDTESAGIGL